MPDRPAQESSLALRPNRRGDELSETESESEWQRADWQKLWLAARSSPWRSLALVPAGKSPADFTLKIAVLLARTGMLHLGVPIQVADGTRVPLSQLVQFSETVDSCLREGDLVIIALSSMSESPNAVTLARNATAALLCVHLGRTTAPEVQETIKALGAKKFLGIATFP